MEPLVVPVAILPHGSGLSLPAYATPGAAGLDLLAAVVDPLVLAPGSRHLVPTGIAVAIPENHEGQVRPRSGLAIRHGLTCLNSPGTIDNDYRGEIKVILANLGNEPFTIERGMRIAQLVVAPVCRIAWQPLASLPGTNRGAAGFGSTGVASAVAR